MVIPDFQSIMLPLLEKVKNGQEYRMIELENQLAHHFNLSEEDRTQLQPSGGETLFQNRARWARFYLMKAALLEDPKRGYTKITKRGLDVLKKGIRNIDLKFLKQYPEFISYSSRKGDDQIDENNILETASKTPEDMIIEGYEAVRSNLEKEILSRIRDNPPEFLETIVLQLVRKMGYGIEHQRLGRTHDEGIDGVIKEDKLGLEEIYFQAKRWQGTIPAPQVRDFAGALLSKKSKKGIFITTSDFSTDAYHYVKTTSDLKIILINGEKLTRLMFDHNLGVTSSGTYEVKKIDDDYFIG